MSGRSDHRKVVPWDAEDDTPQFEKMGRRERTTLPVSSGRSAQRTAKKTHGSERVKKSISRQSGGMHRRRNKTIR